MQGPETRDWNNPAHNPTMLSRTGKVIYGMRWLLVPLYLGLFIILAAFDFHFFSEMVTTAIHFIEGKDANLLILVIDAMDTIMVANFVYLLAVSGYGLFVNEYSKLDFGGKPPLWIDDANSSFKQKIKMSVSLIGISSVHLLHSFVEAETLAWEVIGKQMAIHGLFLISTIALCGVYKAMHSGEHHTGAH